MKRISFARTGWLSAVLVAGSLAAATPAAAGGLNLECTGSGTGYFICDLAANEPGANFSNERWTRDGLAYSVGDNHWSVKFLCNSQPSVVVGVTYTDSSGELWGESTEWYCS